MDSLENKKAVQILGSYFDEQVEDALDKSRKALPIGTLSHDGKLVKTALGWKPANHKQPHQEPIKAKPLLKTHPLDKYGFKDHQEFINTIDWSKPESIESVDDNIHTLVKNTYDFNKVSSTISDENVDFAKHHKDFVDWKAVLKGTAIKSLSEKSIAKIAEHLEGGDWENVFSSKRTPAFMETHKDKIMPHHLEAIHEAENKIPKGKLLENKNLVDLTKFKGQEDLKGLDRSLLKQRIQYHQKDSDKPLYVYKGDYVKVEGNTYRYTGPNDDSSAIKLKHQDGSVFHLPTNKLHHIQGIDDAYKNNLFDNE